MHMLAASRLPDIRNLYNLFSNSNPSFGIDTPGSHDLFTLVGCASVKCFGSEREVILPEAFIFRKSSYSDDELRVSRQTLIAMKIWHLTQQSDARPTGLPTGSCQPY